MNDAKMRLLYNNNWSHLTGGKKSQARLRILSPKFIYKLYVYLIFMYKIDLILNNLQSSIRYKTEPSQTN